MTFGTAAHSIWDFVFIVRRDCCSGREDLGKNETNMEIRHVNLA